MLALCLGGLLSYAVYARVATERTVLAVAATVYRGEVVEPADLTSVTLHGDLTGQTVPADQRASVVGKRAVFDLPAGALVGPASVTDAAVPGTGSAVVGLRLATGKAPTALLVPDAPVRIVALPPPSNGTGSSDALAGKTYAGPGGRTSPGPDGTSVVVDVEVAAEQAPTIALLAASGPDRAGPRRGAVTGMAILLLTSTAGAPASPPLAVGLALTWPRPVLLADCDPGAHQAVLAGLPRRPERRWPGAAPGRGGAPGPSRAARGGDRPVPAAERRGRTSAGCSCPASPGPAAPACSAGSGPSWPTPSTGSGAWATT